MMNMIEVITLLIFVAFIVFAIWDLERDKK